MSQAETRLPNFFIVGAPKAGTTSLYHHLDQHPEVFMSPMKETSYFSREMRLERFAPELQALGKRSAESLRAYLDAPPLGRRFGGIVSEWDDYRRLFSGVRQERAIGEASPGYLWSKTAAARIADFAPAAKILIILRNPIDRAYSQYLQMANTGDYRRSFREHLKACLAHPETEEISVLHPFLEYGLYADQVKRYIDVFPASQVGLWLYEDSRAPGFLRTVFEFLEVDGGFRPDISKRHLEQRIPRVPYLNRLLRRLGVAEGVQRLVPASMRPWLRKAIYRPRNRVKMTPAERSMLAAYYRQDVSRLESLLQRDLSSWLRCE